MQDYRWASVNADFDPNSSTPRSAQLHQNPLDELARSSALDRHSPVTALRPGTGTTHGPLRMRNGHNSSPTLEFHSPGSASPVPHQPVLQTYPNGMQNGRPAQHNIVLQHDAAVAPNANGNAGPYGRSSPESPFSLDQQRAIAGHLARTTRMRLDPALAQHSPGVARPPVQSVLRRPLSFAEQAEPTPPAALAAAVPPALSATGSLPGSAAATAPSRPRLLPSPSHCPAMLKLFDHAEQFSRLVSSGGLSYGSFVDTFYAPDAVTRFILLDEHDKTSVKEHAIPSYALSSFLRALTDSGVTEITTALHAVTELAIVEPTMTETGAVQECIYGYRVEVPNTTWITGYRNGTSVRSQGSTLAEFVLVPSTSSSTTVTFNADRPAMEERPVTTAVSPYVLKIRSLHHIMKEHAHSVLRSALKQHALDRSRLQGSTETKPQQQFELFESLGQPMASSIPNLPVGSYGWPDHVMNHLELVNASTNFVHLMTCALEAKADPLDMYVKWEKGGADQDGVTDGSPNTARQPLPQQQQMPRSRPSLAMLDIPRQNGAHHDSSAPLSAPPPFTEHEYRLLQQQLGNTVQLDRVNSAPASPYHQSSQDDSLSQFTNGSPHASTNAARSTNGYLSSLDPLQH